MTLAKAVDGWLTGAATGLEAAHIDSVTWPGNKPCASAGDLVSL